MATIVRGDADEIVDRVKAVLDEYEAAHEGANATLYRQNSASVRIRIVDDRFTGLSKGQRHDALWDFIAARLSDDDLQDISLVLPFTRQELGSSLMNQEYEHPTDSRR